jgi:hypothetical protein
VVQERQLHQRPREPDNYDQYIHAF